MKFRISYIHMQTRKKEFVEKECRDHDEACEAARKLSNVYWVEPVANPAPPAKRK